ncbi:MAG TPA: amidohydrolase family protein [Steroidobacteraceae bacterium]|jgi:predicted TIM-barrel fold metal-dependent hydrolase|nr:amidohydrolase family protein [Steroidobacteraceae bacterium]
MRTPSILALLAASVSLLGCSIPADRPDAQATYSMADFAAARKFDSHTHVNSLDPGGLLEQAQRDGFELLSINVDYPAFNPLEEQYRIALELQRREPRRFHFAATFSMAGWDNPGWSDRVSEHLRDAASHGALAVKVWKNIGMSFRDRNGKLVMLDDPGFDPVWRQIEALGVPLIGHLGEPRNCWLPLDQMTTENDRGYFREHPEYYMYLHPEMPSYEEQIAARDRFLVRAPQKLRFVGAHLASLEWSVDELARFLDRNPHAFVDLAARMTNVQAQSSERYDAVREFFIRYQDRILYATDLTQGADTTPAEVAQEAATRWRADWKYLATGESQNVEDLRRDVRGLSLPRAVIDKIYYTNAQAAFSLTRQ